MLIFLDESIRDHSRTGRKFGVLAGVAMPEDTFHTFQADMFGVRKPYHGTVLGEDSEVHGNKLLNSTTLRVRRRKGYSQQWNLAEDLLHFARSRNIKVFGVVCFSARDSTRSYATTRRIWPSRIGTSSSGSMPT